MQKAGVNLPVRREASADVACPQRAAGPARRALPATELPDSSPALPLFTIFLLFFAPRPDLFASHSLVPKEIM
jgi:hypothetical protein